MEWEVRGMCETVENKEKLISVIIPIYKTEKYIEDCINSVIQQSYTKLQIILVDDGSPDACGEICDEFAKKDARIEVIHQANSGVSKARNQGLCYAKGELIAFLDSDDILPLDAYEKLINHFDDCEMVIGRVQSLSEKNELCEISKPFGKQEINQEQFLLDLFIEKKYSYLGYLWDKLFKRDIIIEKNLTFDSQIKVNEDRLFVMEYAQHCATIRFCDDIVYFYRQREDGVIKDTRSQKTVSDTEMTILKSFQKMQSLGERYSETIYYAICYKSFECAIDLLNRVSNKDKSKKKILRQFLGDCVKKCLKNPKESILKKVKIIVHYFLEG